MTDKERIERAVNTALYYGPCEGDEHKMWVIDQMLRELLPEEEYKARIEEVEGDLYEWDTGVAP